MKKLSLVCLGILCVSAISTSYAKEPKNLTLTKASLVQYHDSGEYEKDQAKVVDRAMQYLKMRLENAKKSGSTKTSPRVRYR